VFISRNRNKILVKNIYKAPQVYLISASLRKTARPGEEGPGRAVLCRSLGGIGVLCAAAGLLPSLRSIRAARDSSALFGHNQGGDDIHPQG